ncbi:MAG: putative membrane protein [Halocynthiibacter sp.]|jgi:putative membrane protein
MLTTLLVLLVAALHAYFAVLEMVLWEKPRTLKIFGNTAEFASESKVLAANQGLYNGFLCAGLLWGLVAGNQSFLVFFLLFVVIAGIYGGLTASRKIIFFQAVPGAAALLAVLFA